MKKWQWRGVSNSGELLNGVIEATNEREAHIKLRQRQIKIEQLKAERKSIFEVELFPTPIKHQEIVIFVRQLSTMIDAGLPIVQCLEIMSAQQTNPSFKRILLDVKDSVSGGMTFAKALQRHPNVFDTLFVNLVDAGEVGGILDTILKRLAIQIEKSAKLSRQVKSAMTYPIGISVVAGIVISVCYCNL